MQEPFMDDQKYSSSFNYSKFLFLLLTIFSIPWYSNIWLFSWQECSVNSPNYGPLPVDAPSWCQAPFDPEGLLRFVIDTSIFFVICQKLMTCLNKKSPFPFNSLIFGWNLPIKLIWLCCSSLMAIVTCFIGLHYGHIIVHFKVNILCVLILSILSFRWMRSSLILLLCILMCSRIIKLEFSNGWYHPLVSCYWV